MDRAAASLHLYLPSLDLAVARAAAESNEMLDSQPTVGPKSNCAFRPLIALSEQLTPSGARDRPASNGDGLLSGMRHEGSGLRLLKIILTPGFVLAAAASPGLSAQSVYFGLVGGWTESGSTKFVLNSTASNENVYRFLRLQQVDTRAGLPE